MNKSYILSYPMPLNNIYVVVEKDKFFEIVNQISEHFMIQKKYHEVYETNCLVIEYYYCYGDNMVYIGSESELKDG